PGAPGILIQGARELGRPVEHAKMARRRHGVVRAEDIANTIGHERSPTIELGALTRIDLAAGEQLEQQGELAVREIEVEPAERLEMRGGIAKRDDVAEPGLGGATGRDRNDVHPL